jgi:hypothetical protein
MLSTIIDCAIKEIVDANGAEDLLGYHPEMRTNAYDRTPDDSAALGAALRRIAGDGEMP